MMKWSPRPFFADAYRIELRTWIAGLSSARPSDLATAQDGLRAMQVAQALITSMHEEGRTVKVSAE